MTTDSDIGHPGVAHNNRGQYPIPDLVKANADLAALKALIEACIMTYAGAVADIPSGWQLCDGTNGTHDLRNQFIVGAGSTYAVGDTGGSATQANHVVTQPNQHTNTGTAHIHTLVSGVTLTAPGGTPNVSSQTDSQGLHTHDAHTGVTVSAHGTNLPPFYAFAFIQKVP